MNHFTMLQVKETFFLHYTEPFWQRMESTVEWTSTNYNFKGVVRGLPPNMSLTVPGKIQGLGCFLFTTPSCLELLTLGGLDFARYDQQFHKQY